MLCKIASTKWIQVNDKANFFLNTTRTRHDMIVLSTMLTDSMSQPTPPLSSIHRCTNQSYLRLSINLAYELSAIRNQAFWASMNFL